MSENISLPRTHKLFMSTIDLRNMMINQLHEDCPFPIIGILLFRGRLCVFSNSVV